mmetsp:Transcript_20525/g.56988  ORF Transcript_20525/g.56988 Transcript_20525/m.56988 type:complete len:203 (-) Transcript_20525:732-1340(-)
MFTTNGAEASGLQEEVPQQRGRRRAARAMSRNQLGRRDSMLTSRDAARLQPVRWTQGWRRSQRMCIISGGEMVPQQRGLRRAPMARVLELRAATSRCRGPIARLAWCLAGRRAWVAGAASALLAETGWLASGRFFSDTRCSSSSSQKTSAYRRTSDTSARSRRRIGTTTQTTLGSTTSSLCRRPRVLTPGWNAGWALSRSLT